MRNKDKLDFHDNDVSPIIFKVQINAFTFGQILMFAYFQILSNPFRLMNKGNE